VAQGVAEQRQRWVPSRHAQRCRATKRPKGIRVQCSGLVRRDVGSEFYGGGSLTRCRDITTASFSSPHHFGRIGVKVWIYKGDVTGTRTEREQPARAAGCGRRGRSVAGAPGPSSRRDAPRVTSPPVQARHRLYCAPRPHPPEGAAGKLSHADPSRSSTASSTTRTARRSNLATWISFGEYDPGLEPASYNVRSSRPYRDDRHIKRGGKVWINIYDRPLTRTPEVPDGFRQGSPDVDPEHQARRSCSSCPGCRSRWPEPMRAHPQAPIKCRLSMRRAG